MHQDLVAAQAVLASVRVKIVEGVRTVAPWVATAAKHLLLVVSGVATAVGLFVLGFLHGHAPVSGMRTTIDSLTKSNQTLTLGNAALKSANTDMLKQLRDKSELVVPVPKATTPKSPIKAASAVARK